MAGQQPDAFPLLVRGDWGAAEPPGALRKKLLCYFQSQKRSGGGECELRAGPAPGHLLVCFAHRDVRQRVLDRGTHELDWGPRGRLVLLVTEVPLTMQEAGAAGEAWGTVNEHQVSFPISKKKEALECAEQEKTESFGNLRAETTVSGESVIVVTTASGEEIEDEIVEMYFENKKKSGGGPIKSCIRKDQQIIITFQDKEDAQGVLQRKHHSVKKIGLLVKPWQEETIQELRQMERTQESVPSALVVLQNVQVTTEDYLLIMLVENISGLSEEDNDFSVEMIPEINAAVVTFAGSIATEEFVKKFNQNHRAKQQSITARCLEVTESIRAENIPPNTSNDYITIYFENKKNGSAQVVDVQQLPEEGAAIITFSDHKDVINILAKQHSLNRVPISVYPYYISLGTALYGKEGPQIKKPDPVTVPLDPYIWQFLQRNNRLIEAINCDMAKCNCELTWPEPSCADPKVTLHLSTALSKQKRLMARLIKTWNESVSTAFSCSISKYKTIKYQVSAEVWEAVRNSINQNRVLISPCVSKELLVLVGDKEDLKNVEQELKLLIENATRKIEREKQKTEEMVEVFPEEYAILQSTGLEEKIRKECPTLQMTYDPLQKKISLCGVSEEAYKVKGEILDDKRKMAKKSVNVHPYIFRFLEHVDNEILSQSLFMSKQISAFYKLGMEAILLTGSTPEMLLKAEEEINKELNYRSIDLEDESVLQKKEWRLLTTQNCSNAAVTVTQVGSQVIVAGCLEAVEKAYEELYDFIDQNTQVQKVIRGKPMAVIMFFEKEMAKVWTKLQSKGLKVDFGTQRKRAVISLSGPRREVVKGVILVEQILSGLHYKRVLINEPGAKLHFKERESFYATTVQQDFNCLVRLEEQPEELEEQQEHSSEGKPYRQATIGGIVIAVYKADLCTHRVDVVVNASNEDLKHIGGLAGALLQAAGPELQAECDILTKQGCLQPGCAVITGAGKLPCKQVIHAVGSRWRKDEAEKCVLLLRESVKKCLQLAETYNHQSIALPSIGAGIFGFPLQLCTYSIVSSIKETLEESRGDSSLKEVHLVDVAEKNVRAFSEALEEVFPDNLLPRGSVCQTDRDKRPRESQSSQNSDSVMMITTEEGLDVILKKGSIEDATTDIVVNSVAKDLQLNRGPLSKALLSKAGPMLQTALKEEGLENTPHEGSVFKTKGYNLGCCYVLHAIIPGWSQGQGSAKKILGNIITKCLQIAEELSLKSITFPAIGTGNLVFPKSVVAKLLFDKVFEFSSKKKVNSLKEVHFLLHPKDTSNVQVFSDELQHRRGNTIDDKAPETASSKASQSTLFFGPISSPARDVHEMMIGSIVFQVAIGDITKEETDVIVNITNKTFSLKKGVSKAILEGAGKAVEDECTQLALQPNNGFITTQGGHLPCKKIIHCVAQDDIKVPVSKVLQECELQQYTSVIFPAIGTGEAGRDPAEAADEIMDAVADFARNNSVWSLKTVKVVIFQPSLLSVFLASMKKREGSGNTVPSKSLCSRPVTLLSSEKWTPKKESKAVLERKMEVAVVQICGENQKKVQETETWLKNAILKEQFQKVITDESILGFGEKENEELHDLQMTLNIVLRLEGTSIRISGVNKDVWLVYSRIQDMIHKVKAAKEEEIKAELLKNVIEWKYFENDSYVPFDNLTNMHLENAFLGKQKNISVTINNKNYRVNMEAKHAEDDQGRSTPILRIDKSEDQESIVLPATWDDMQTEQVKVVELKPEMKEYKDVQARFLQTCPLLKIEKIERIQNPFFWKAYQIKKLEMDKKNGNRNNERLLFHGTSSDSLAFINKNGFNRSYAGMNAASFGNGTYFAVNANYSASDTYSKPDVDGKKYMYLARVLVGEYSLGRKGAITPAVKNTSNSIDLFDSSTDNMNRPSMFIIFNDIQAYPEYLITFTR
ncbi:protein mono-ADP-ribosyltransferase PARP14-like [Rhea pennata]|uniref:protein mono-ADP-ribosyltransferase PARP14-like n=1 Tax=Rhea pennata TaxID=8795 RepID=UPI002E25D55E